MIKLLEDEIKYVNDLSYKWKYDEDDSRFSSLFDNSIITSNLQMHWKILTDYWVRFAEKGDEYSDKVVSLADEGNVYAVSAVAKIYLKKANWEEKRSIIEDYIDETIKAGIGYLALEYASILKNSEKDKSHYYFDIASKYGCDEAQNTMLFENVITEQEKTVDNKIKISHFSFASEIIEPGYLLNDLGSEFAEPIGISNMMEISVREVERCLEAECRMRGIPVLVSVTSLTSGGFMNTFFAMVEQNDASKGGGLLNKTVLRALKVSHPNPPQQYCDELFVFMNDGVRFFFIGSSKAFKEMNEYNTVLSGDFDRVGFISKMKFFTGGRPDEEAYNKEMSWHQAVYEAFNSLI
ncbi:MAG: hypothetical protein NC393_00580 [Clostridium sp.]|nr:hypothetical protein [Clostridium sp.]MCM1207309.1 hypothetical protein [Ruminococcus sp.]